MTVDGKVIEVVTNDFELWFWRRVLRVSWMEKKTNMWIIENIKPEWTLESRVRKAALSYSVHVLRAGGMEDDVMLGIMNGARRRGRPRERWLDTFKGYSSGASISNLVRDANDRAGWRGAATAVARSRTLNIYFSPSHLSASTLRCVLAWIMTCQCFRYSAVA